jgi:hypothetical protein
MWQILVEFSLKGMESEMLFHQPQKVQRMTSIAPYFLIKFLQILHFKTVTADIPYL